MPDDDAVFSEHELMTALTSIASTLRKCEKARPKLAVGTSQHTLIVRRIRAFEIAMALIVRELEQRS